MRAIRGFSPALAVLLAGLTFLHARPDEGVSIQAEKTHVDFKVAGNLVTSYRFDPKQSKPWFYPMYALPGQEITEPGPKDHIHHRSAWFCHGDVIPEGLDYKKRKGVEGVDFWSEGKGHGKIVCVRVDKPKIEKDHGSIVTVNEWRTAEGQKVLDEVRTIHFYHLGPNANLIVLDIDLDASVAPLTFGDTKEGSMGIRIRDSVRVDRKKGGRLTNAEGKVNQGKGFNEDRKGCWGLVSGWCDYSGPVGEGKTAGLAIFADPTNSVDSAWHARDYGLLAANPFGRQIAKFPDRKDKKELVKLKKGEHLKLRYGLYLHASDVKEGKVAQVYAKFTKLAGK
jgi:hypothetical protein